MLAKIIGRKKARYVYRSAVTGEFVSRAHALLHPFTTTKEKVDA
jgi:hypothetical protein